MNPDQWWSRLLSEVVGVHHGRGGKWGSLGRTASSEKRALAGLVGRFCQGRFPIERIVGSGRRYQSKGTRGSAAKRQGESREIESNLFENRSRRSRHENVVRAAGRDNG